jgi:hypothetical protein
MGHDHAISRADVITMNVNLKVPVSSQMQFSPGLRLGVYAALLLAIAVMLSVGSAINTSSNTRLLFVMMMSALCFSPILSLDRINGKFLLLFVYMAVDFQYFAFGDLMLILFGRTPERDQGILSGSELVILASAVGVFGGYHAAVRWLPPKRSSEAGRDWPFSTVIAVGLLFWLSGTACLTYWQTYIITDRSNVTLIKNINMLGPALTTVFMFGQLIQPLGIMILAYAYGAYRRTFLLPIIIIVVLVQIVLGFVADFKSEAMLAGLLVIVTKIYVDGKLPKAWLIGGALFIVFVFPVFQAYRVEIRGEHGVTSADAIQNLIGTVQKAIEAQAKLQSGFGGAEYRVNSFWERASLKSSVDLLVDNVGKNVPYQMGATLTPIATAFVPRILWPSKESIAVGQVFNKTFHLSSVEDTYISPSHVGEVYWNFGWGGILLIMPAIGLLLGFIGSRCIPNPLSLTRLMVLLVTIFAFVIRSEGSIATEVVVWMRSMVAIGLLHLMFSRSTPAFEASGPNAALSNSTGPLGTPSFPNLLR